MTMASGRSAGATRYCLREQGPSVPPRQGRGRLPTTPTDDPARPPESYTGLRYQALPGVKRKTEKSLPAADDSLDPSSRGAGGRSRMSPKCYAQVAKSPNYHQGAGIGCKSKRVIPKLALGLPPIPTQQL